MKTQITQRSKLITQQLLQELPIIPSLLSAITFCLSLLIIRTIPLLRSFVSLYISSTATHKPHFFPLNAKFWCREQQLCVQLRRFRCLALPWQPIRRRLSRRIFHLSSRVFHSVHQLGTLFLIEFWTQRKHSYRNLISSSIDRVLYFRLCLWSEVNIRKGNPCAGK